MIIDKDTRIRNDVREYLESMENVLGEEIQMIGATFFGSRVYFKYDGKIIKATFNTPNDEDGISWVIKVHSRELLSTDVGKCQNFAGCCSTVGAMGEPVPRLEDILLRWKSEGWKDYA